MVNLQIPSVNLRFPTQGQYDVLPRSGSSLKIKVSTSFEISQFQYYLLPIKQAPAPHSSALRPSSENTPSPDRLSQPPPSDFLADAEICAQADSDVGADPDAREISRLKRLTQRDLGGRLGYSGTRRCR